MADKDFGGNIIQKIMQEMKNLYLHDSRPWIVGLSGGKDSTCVTQMVYYMLLSLPPEQRKKEIHIISADTLVESPLIARRITSLLSDIDRATKKDHLPIKVKLLKPKLNDTFWVNLIGRGYPSPNRWFRWCTDRLKIQPATDYILEQVKHNGEVIILLGARKSESASRSQTMGKYEIKNFNLRKHSEIRGAFVYTPIEDLTHNNLWAYLLQVAPPWGGSNQELRTFYRKIDGECPLIIDKKSPSCGGSRFGCWTCTVVEHDRALEGLIEDGDIWLEPLLIFRNWLKEIRDDPSKRNTIRKNERKKKILADKTGKNFIQAAHRGHNILGPFTFETRHKILKKLINLQRQIRQVQNIELITPEELQAIETIWIYEGDSISSLSDIIDTSKDFVNSVKKSPLEKNHINGTIFERIIQKYDLPLSLVEKLLVAEKDLSSFSGRTGVYNRLENVIEEHMINTYLEKKK
jgi:DNA sulfur modification protein DndC